MSLTGSDITAAFKKHPVGLSCGLLALLLVVAIYFRHGAVATVEATLEERTGTGERQKANLRNAALLDEHLRAVQAANTAVQSRVISSGSLALNLQYFYQIESELGVELLELRQLPVTPAKPPAHFVAVPYVVAVQGTYPQLLAFIERLENGLHFARITSAALVPAASAARSPESDPTAPLTLNLNVDLLGTS